MYHNVIGLFGTCGKSTWRDPFVFQYSEKGIPYFNPQMPEGTWHPGCVDDENKHLMTDGIILFPVLSETTGQGSLAEIGFSITAALSRNPDRYFIFLIDPECTDPDASAAQIKESNRTRALVSSKLIQMSKSNSGIFIVDSLKQMLKLSLALHKYMFEFNNIRKMSIV